LKLFPFVCQFGLVMSLCSQHKSDKTCNFHRLHLCLRGKIFIL